MTDKISSIEHTLISGIQPSSVMLCSQNKWKKYNNLCVLTLRSGQNDDTAYICLFYLYELSLLKCPVVGIELASRSKKTCIVFPDLNANVTGV